eukprot:UN10185
MLNSKLIYMKSDDVLDNKFLNLLYNNMNVNNLYLNCINWGRGLTIQMKKKRTDNFDWLKTGGYAVRGYLSAHWLTENNNIRNLPLDLEYLINR